LTKKKEIKGIRRNNLVLLSTVVQSFNSLACKNCNPKFPFFLYEALKHWLQ